MKLAFLQCDHVNDEHQEHIGGDYNDVFTQLFNEHAPEINLEIFDITQGDFPKDLDDFDAFITSGSQYSVYDDIQWIKDFKTLIKQLYEQNKILVGICFGHQMIAEALGGEVEPSINGWALGVHTFHMTKHPNWFVSEQFEFNVIMSCKDQVKTLPEDSFVIAENHFCPVAIYRIGETFLGIQGHPEWTKEYSHATMEHRKKNIPEAVLNNAKRSLDEHVDQRFMFDMILSFLRSRVIKNSN